MKEQNNINFARIAHAIGYLKDNFKEQPNLDEVAEKIHMSPFHFQKMFTDWAGVSPKKFVQYLSIEHAKKLLTSTSSTLFDAAYETGLSGTGRLHDLFVNIEGMTPGEYKNGGESLHINYNFSETPFGTILAASTAKGICHLAFADNETQALDVLRQKFPNAVYKQITDLIQQQALHAFSHGPSETDKIKLHLKGTPFQLKVWEALLSVPLGKLATYGSIASRIDSPKASRAVGTAVGDNPVAFIIPCHRIIQSSGVLGNYHWGSTRKAAMIGWEAAKTNL
ncbi:methylated-DNA--[protein]-cysteine S-methyltransferase [Flavobacterium cerinum]|uniref:methylated-DNA--[protein]-cysteine S-methyltransferase n=1 Tax=Flavobacterium cerinum TaxID=2502784 RepID=A0A444HBJ3_9FLAO|nr:methylated-DNA--[protein]-cysteine S-methyltransferase [Flavobacterium cerinum]RWX00851.1 methylated-DNA--[protein]-cysteine S-methyltransferase [Flavobacterium cerinum]